MKKALFFILIMLSTIIVTAIPSEHTAYAQTSQPSISLDPTTYNSTQLNETFTVNIDIANSPSLWAWIVNVTWDSKYLSFQRSSEGAFLKSQVDSTLYLASQPYNFTDLYHNSDTYRGIELQAAVSSSSDGQDQSANGSGVLATMQFQIIQQTLSTPITLTVENLEGPNPINATTGAAHPQIKPVSDSATSIVSLIIPGPPTANAGRDESVLQGTQVIFNASQSVSSGTNTTYTWTFTDGTLQNLTGMIANYTFNNIGTYNVTLTVQDSLGSSNCTLIVRVMANPALTATATPVATTTPNGDSTPSPTITSTPVPASTSTQNSGSFSLPPTILGILVIITIFVFGGSFFWLRKRT